MVTSLRFAHLARRLASSVGVILLACSLSASSSAADTPDKPPYLPIAARPVGATDPMELFAIGNLHAWCVPPFDAKKRTPEERAEMLQKLGFKHFVYDWRPKDIPTFDDEIAGLKKRGIEMRGWWSPTDPRDPVLKQILEVFKRQDVHPQLWVMGSGSMTKTPEEQKRRVEQEADRIRQIADLARPYGCKVELYNHGGWFGQTDNQVAIIEHLKTLGTTDVGIVYNFSHGHGDIADFAAIWKRMQPYVVTVNVTGMVENGESKIMPPSQGKFELDMLRVVLDSGWKGPIGVIAEQGGDAEVTLGNYLRGLEWCKKELVEPGSGGPKPNFTPTAAPRPSVTLVPGKFGKALEARAGGLLLPGRDEWRTPPITVETWAKLRSSNNFSVIVASDPKSSSEHWELYAYAREGDFSVYLPGKGGEARSGVKICDDQWHHLAMVLERDKVRLFVDGKMVKEKALPPVKGAVTPGDLAIGRTVEDGTGCDGLVDDVRISHGVREITAVPAAALTKDDATLGLWPLDEAPKTAAASLPAREPLDPAAHPLSNDPINRERIYDFYAKQAIDYAARRDKPEFLAAFPGLDSGRSGHWGNQTESTWNNDKWNRMDVGSAMAGVFRRGDRTVARAVCVKLGEAAACFDPDTLTWPEAWRGGFVKFGTARFGFLGGVTPAGATLPAPEGLPAKAGDFTYRGYFRHGERVIFSYQRDGAEWLEAATSEGGRVSAVRERTGAGPLTALTRGGPAQWPQVFETKGQLGTAKPYAMDTLTLPKETPWRSLWHLSGHDFFLNGEAALCTFEGEVWIVSGIDAGLGKLRWRRFAAGLHEPLGLIIVDGKICVLGRDQITRLHDLNGDGEADYYECFARGYLSPTGGHDFVTGLERDAQGRFYLASGAQGVVRIAPGGPAEVLATGFRNPNGVGLGPKGDVAVAVQEGDWTPASMLYEFLPKAGETPGHYGYGGPKPGPRGHLPPLAYLPRGEDHSCGGQAYVQGNRWGVPAGTLIHFSWGNGTAFLVLRETLGDTAQGTVIPLPGDFLAGAHRGRFNPSDGQFYVTGMTGWITYAPDDGCFQRLRYTGAPVAIPTATEARNNGVLLRFAVPLDARLAADPRRYFAQQWNYRYGAAYGSEEYSVRRPTQKGHDPLAVVSAQVLENGRTLFLEIPQLQPSNVLHLRCDLPGLLARDFYLTLHQLGAEFTAFPGYRAVTKTADPHAGHGPATEVTALPPRPVKWEEGAPGRALRLQTASGMTYAQKELRAKPGERLSLTFENPDAMPHNWVLIKPGSLERVGALANKIITEPDAVSRHYVPESPDILCHTRILDPQKRTTVNFNAPDKPGRYPYICTFPGHWMLMRGELIVE
jgi:azurin/sugar phosphate isomerase/epimerase